MRNESHSNFQEVIESLGFDYKKLAVSLDGGSFTLLELEISPIESLEQAESDFVSSESSMYLNCIPNAKRAIVGQMDQILYSFGFNPFRWNVRKKMEKLNELGVLTPTILRKVSKVRNLLEHNYSKPSKNEVELALDIASLFVLSNIALFNFFESTLIFRNDENASENNIFSGITIGLERNHTEVFWRLYGYENSDNVLSCKLYKDDPFFTILVKLCTALQLRYKVEEAFNLLNQTCEKYSSIK